MFIHWGRLSTYLWLRLRLYLSYNWGGKDCNSRPQISLPPPLTSSCSRVRQVEGRPHGLSLGGWWPPPGGSLVSLSSPPTLPTWPPFSPSLGSRPRLSLWMTSPNSSRSNTPPWTVATLRCTSVVWQTSRSVSTSKHIFVSLSVSSPSSPTPPRSPPPFFLLVSYIVLLLLLLLLLLSSSLSYSTSISSSSSSSSSLA